MVSISSIQLYHDSCLSIDGNVLKNLTNSRSTFSTIFASFHFLLVNCVPRSTSFFCGFPTLLVNSSTSFTVASQVALFIEYNSVYFVNVSIITKIYSYPYFVFTKGPKKSMDSSFNGSSGCTDSWMMGNDVVSKYYFIGMSHRYLMFT